MEHDGWLLDLYPAPGKMVAWLKDDDGRAAKLEEPWLPSLYVKLRGARERDLDQFDHLIAGRAWESRFAEPSDGSASQVLRIRAQAHNLVRLAEALEEKLPYGSYKIYNADVGPAQAYLYERDLFPLARVKAQDNCGRLKWTLLDDVESTSYDTSFLKVMRLKLRSETENRLQRFTEPIAGFSLETPGNGEKVSKVSESETILSIIEEIAREDPDILLTGNGDSFMLPYLGFRARENGLSNRLILGREPRPYSPPRSDGKSYFSYGRVLYKAASSRLYGRVHIDEANTFVYSDCGLQGLFEVSRTCRIPLHDAARGSIGKCMSSLQFYYAQKKGVLVPWRASRPEHFKDAYDLLIADRGGFIFEPRAGLHRERRGGRFQLVVPQHHAQVQSKRRDGPLRLLLHLRVQDSRARARLPRLRKEAGHRPQDPRDPAEEEGRVQAPEEGERRCPEGGLRHQAGRAQVDSGVQFWLPRVQEREVR